MSGHRNGPKTVGARGKRKARNVVSRPGYIATKTDEEVVGVLEEGMSRIKKLMRPHDQAAVDTLAAIAGDEEAPAGARITAATRIIEWSHGKPLPIVGNTSGVGTGNGLTIVVNRFFDTDQPVTIEGEIAEIMDGE